MDGNTDVNTTELRTFADGMRGRADEILTTSQTVGAIDYDLPTFGFLVWFFCTDLQNTSSQTAEGLQYLSNNIGMDATAISDAAMDYDTNEDNQTQRFRGEHP